MSEGDWDHRCYDAVEWDTVEDDSTLLYRTSAGSWILGLVGSVVANVTSDAIQPYIQETLLNQEDQSREDLKTQVNRLECLFPFVNYADTFLGQRRHWIEDKLDDVSDFLEFIEDENRYDEFEHLGGYSSNELIQTLKFLIATNAVLNDEGPKKIVELTGEDVDFCRDLIAVGGPISNLYTRNLMYGDVVDLPYRFNLNPDDGSDDTTKIDPLELRKMGIADNRGFDRRPNWTLVDREGELVEVEGNESRPRHPPRENTWIRDYFTIIKAPNVHPSAEQHQRTDAVSLVLCGCHGLGTRAAIAALQTDHVLETLKSEAGDGYFQALGRVHRTSGHKIEADQLTVPAEHVRPIGGVD